MQDSWPAVPFREWTPVCGAAAPLVSMFRHWDVLVPGCAPCLVRPMAAVGASVLSLKLPHHSQHSHSPRALRIRPGRVISSTEQTKTCSMGTEVLQWEQLVLSWAQAGPHVPNAPSPQQEGCAGLEKGQPLPPEEWGLREEQEVWGLGLPVGFWTHSHKEQIKHPDSPRHPQLQGVVQLLQEIISWCATGFLPSSFLLPSPVPDVYSQPSIPVFPLTSFCSKHLLSSKHLTN